MKLNCFPSKCYPCEDLFICNLSAHALWDSCEGKGSLLIWKFFPKRNRSCLWSYQHKFLLMKRTDYSLWKSEKDSEVRVHFVSPAKKCKCNFMLTILPVLAFSFQKHQRDYSLWKSEDNQMHWSFYWTGCFTSLCMDILRPVFISSWVLLSAERVAFQPF